MTVFPVGSSETQPDIPNIPALITIVHDATASNIGSLPDGPGIAAGYDTGSPDIVWTAADFAAHPRALHIDQNPSGDVPTADVLDVEGGAATPDTAPHWVGIARRSIAAKSRLGQRNLPVIYMSADNVTAVVNALIAGGIKHNVGLWVANYNLTQSEAESMVLSAGGPFPIVGVQYTDNPPDGRFDTSVFSTAYLTDVVDSTDWIHLAGIPADASVYFNQNRGTLGYINSTGVWTRVKL
jgi:hypothetical protein